MCNQLPKGVFVFQQNILQSKLFKNVTVHFIFLLCTVVDVKDGEFSPLSTLCLFYVLCKRHLRNIYVEGYDSNQSIGLFLLRKTEVAVSQPLTLTNAVNSWLRGFLLACFFFFFLEDGKRKICLLQICLHGVKARCKTSPVHFRGN